jgi:hypothetical protein
MAMQISLPRATARSNAFPFTPPTAPSSSPMMIAAVLSLYR